MEIRKKMPLFILLIVVIPIVIISSAVYFWNSRSMLKKSKSNMSISANLVSNHVSDIIKNEQDQVYMLSQENEIIDAAKERQQGSRQDFLNAYGYDKSPADLILERKFKRFQNHEHLSLIDPDGIVICDSNPDNIKVDLSNRDYFKQAMSGKEYVSDTILSKINKKSVVVFTAPVKDENGKVIGVVGDAVYTDFFTNSLSKIKFGSTGYAYMVDNKGIMLSHPDKNKILKPVENSIIKQAADKIEKGQSVESDVQLYKYDGDEKLSGYVVIPGVRWILTTSQSMSEVNEDTRNILFINCIIGIITVLLAVLIGLKFSSGITVSLGKLLALMDRASKGDITVRSDISRSDEIGKLSTGFNKMIQSLSDIIKNVKNNSADVEEQSINLSSVSEEMASSSQNVADSIQEVAKGAESQAEDLVKINSIVNNFAVEIENIVESIKEMYKNIGDINGMSVNSNDKMKIVKGSINDVSSSFKDFLKKIDNLDKGIKQINSIIDIINDIADQTNLLALNASIESARVGEAGKGFAVVANEIGELAEQSKKSAKNISTLIGNISGDTKLMVQSTGLMNEELSKQIDAVGVSIEAFRDIAKAVKIVNSKVNEVHNSASKIDSEKNKIVDKLESASSAAEQISASTQEISATSEEMSASTEEISSSADKLSNMTKGMADSVKKFNIA
ncbi:methyl-accepting chemotaxis protein [Clostridium sp. JNZ X4-2]